MLVLVLAEGIMELIRIERNGMKRTFALYKEPACDGSEKRTPSTSPALCHFSFLSNRFILLAM